MALPDEFKAFVADASGSEFARGVRSVPARSAEADEIAVRVAWSGLNFKDSLASEEKGRVAQMPVLVPGIDLAGHVVDSSDPQFPVGAPVVAHGYGLGVSHHGGFAEYAVFPSAWALPLPHGLTLREAMAVGTAGFTAALAVGELERHGMVPSAGPVAVTGATGGVGSAAVGILASKGYEVVALSRKDSAADFLLGLGAAAVEAPDESGQRPLDKERWAFAVDAVGGQVLTAIVKGTRYGGAVAAIGNAGGPKLDLTVFPFILRAVSLLGIDSVQVPMEFRTRVWESIAAEGRPGWLERVATNEVTLDELERALAEIRAGNMLGRTLVRLSGES
jgi:acrylyl-CoA reductase (NADPH)